MKTQKLFVKKLVYSAVCLAIAFVLPLLTGNIREIGTMLCPMHIPVLLCGFLCGWSWGAAVGFSAPLLRSLIFKMPHLYPNAVGMAFELAVYGFLTGLLYKKLPKKIGYTYLTLILSMIVGRAVWGIAQTVLFFLGGKSFTIGAFVAGAITSSVPGIVLQILLIPIIVSGLKKAKLILND